MEAAYKILSNPKYAKYLSEKKTEAAVIVMPNLKKEYNNNDIVTLFDPLQKTCGYLHPLAEAVTPEKNIEVYIKKETEQLPEHDVKQVYNFGRDPSQVSK